MRGFVWFLALAVVVSSGPLAAHQTRARQTQEQTDSVPRVIRITGALSPAIGRPLAQVETITLRVYADETSEAVLWEETQHVIPGSDGRYSVLLGSTRPDGLPLDVFTSGEARWVGVTLEGPGERESARMRLVSVPYALRASDADTLGGLPASAFVRATDTADATTARPATGSATATAADAPSAILPGTPTALAKYSTSTDLVGSSIFALSNGLHGVNTATPRDVMHVQFTNTSGSLTGYAVQNLGNTATSYSGTLFYDHNGVLGQFQGFNNVTHEYRINNVARNGASQFDGTINFMVGGTSRFFVRSNGFVGLGTTTPTGPLEVVRDGGYADSYFTSYVNTGSATFQDIQRARGSVESPLPVLSGDTIASIGARGWNGSFFARAARIEVLAGGDFSTTQTPTSIRFLTTPTASIVTSERMRITGAGDVGIGTITPAARLQVMGDVRVGTSGTNGCLQRFDGTGIAGVCASDRRFKRDITPFGNMLQAVAALRPVHYYWRTAEFADRHFGSEQSYGLIAQEVEEVLPELVVTNGDGYKAVDYTKLPLLAVQAIKELKAENDALQARLAELERMMNEVVAGRR